MPSSPGRGQGHAIARGCGMGFAATMSLLERVHSVVGTDGWSWDAPFGLTKQRGRETGDASPIRKGHRAGRQIGHCHMNKLSGLEVLPADGFWVESFPVRVHRTAAGWTRTVAIVDEP